MKLMKVNDDRYILVLTKVETIRVAYAFLRGEMQELRRNYGW